MTCTQDESYSRIGSRIVEDVMEGYNGTIMAYGQTGSGKSYTIFGKKESMNYQNVVHPDMGIVPRAVKHLFNLIKDKAHKVQFQVRVCFMQVYLEQITDLIQEEDSFKEVVQTPMNFSKHKRDASVPKDGLQIREDPKTGIFVKGLKQIRVMNEEELLNLIKYGSKYRITSATSMNKTSSRSHAILQILVEQKWIEGGKDSKDLKDNNNETQIEKKRIYKKGLLTIVDLAGSERISKSGSGGVRLEEAKKINTSLSALGICINALANNASLQHIPFRDSKLTRILTECLGGNSKTSICANISPFLMNYDETLTTLQFASRANKIKVNAKINEKIELKAKKDEKEIVELKLKKNVKFNNEETTRSKSEDKFKGNVNNSNISVSNYNNDEHKEMMYKNHNNNNHYHSANKQEQIHLEEYMNLTKKYFHMVMHLQNELAKATVNILNLQEENKLLKDKLAKTNY